MHKRVVRHQEDVWSYLDSKSLAVLFWWRMLVGAPWDGPPNNRRGDVYKCIVGEEKNSNCSKVNLGEIKWILNESSLPEINQVYMNYSVTCSVCVCVSGETALQNISKNVRNSHLGMTLTPDSPDGFLVCLFNCEVFFMFCYVAVWRDVVRPGCVCLTELEWISSVAQFYLTSDVWPHLVHRASTSWKRPCGHSQSQTHR